MCTSSPYEESGDFFQTVVCLCTLLHKESVMKTLLLWNCTLSLSNSKRVVDLILSNISIFKPMSLPVAGSFTVSAWIWNVAIYTAGTK
jgi:hypothetical protein